MIITLSPIVVDAPKWTYAHNINDGYSNTYARWTSSIPNDQAVCTLYYELGDIPFGSIINSVKARVRHYESTGANTKSIHVAGISVPVSVSNRTDVVDLPAQLIDRYDILHVKANNTNTSYCHIDYAELEIDYTPQYILAYAEDGWKPVEGVGNGMGSIVELQIFNGTHWVTPTAILH